ncbi:MAG: nucleotide exchange factor GrpE [Blastochloris sp.]|nr:nucleotide exchange factor GrpE [Blastochloris sp.]
MSVQPDQHNQHRPDTPPREAHTGVAQAEVPGNVPDGEAQKQHKEDNVTIIDQVDQVDQIDHDEAAAADQAAAKATMGESQPASTDELAQRLEEAEKQASEYKEQWLRAMADFKNHKRRTEIERTELVRNAGVSVVLKLLPVADDFERAASSIPPDIAETSWWQGTQLVMQKLRTLLESEGVTPIDALGTDFDPNLHDAVMYEEAEGQDGKVTAELQKGYRINDRVLRPTMVKVGKG